MGFHCLLWASIFQVSQFSLLHNLLMVLSFSAFQIQLKLLGQILDIVKHFPHTNLLAASDYPVEFTRKYIKKYYRTVMKGHDI